MSTCVQPRPFRRDSAFPSDPEERAVDDSHVRSAGVPAGRTVALTLAALVSFALNSLLCRAALGAGLIDAVTFTLVRLATGAATLLLLARASGGSPLPPRGTSRSNLVASATALFLYALPFSLAYRRMSAGTGAFVVFCCVQITMIGADLISGGRLWRREVLGLGLALLGLAVLTRPGLESPDLPSVALMGVAGFSWGIYSLRGRSGGPALEATARNFAAAVPLALVAWVMALSSVRATLSGLALATVSGALTSGLGYVAWYAALPALRPKHAALVQLSVPPLASVLGILFLHEQLTTRLLLAAPMILAGIALAVFGPKR